MKLSGGLITAATIMILSSIASAQTTKPVEIGPGMTIRPTGVIDIGDMFVEVNYYDSSWTISQQHDKITVTKGNTPTTQPGVYNLVGILSTAQGPANWTQRVETLSDGIKYSAEFKSDKPLATNELGMAFILPTKTFAGKQIMIDQQSLTLPEKAAAQGQARIMEKPAVKEVDLPTPTGTLAITGDFGILIQDDREWGDPRFSMRLYFTPAKGQITDSKIELTLKWKKAEGK